MASTLRTINHVKVVSYQTVFSCVIWQPDPLTDILRSRMGPFLSLVVYSFMSSGVITLQRNHVAISLIADVQ